MASEVRGLAPSVTGVPSGSDTDMKYLQKHMERIRTHQPRPAETPAHLSTPMAERGVLEQIASDDDPKKRMEWQRMLRSVLESDVLSSETKRITAAEASAPTPAEVMHRVWLSLHAMYAGRPEYMDQPEGEESYLREERARIVPNVMDDVLRFRESATETSPKEEVYKEVVTLLDRVDYVTRLFPSHRQLAEAYPAWTHELFQRKLAAIVAWHNVAHELSAQVRLLQKWTGTLTSPGGTLRPTIQSSQPGDVIDDDLTVIERIFRESTMHQTFEQRSLRRLRVLVELARDALRDHHDMFSQLHLPSLESDTLPLVRFPMWLAEGALRQRLEYADKLKEPSILLVDSLADDLRSVLALACRIKDTYTLLTIPEPEIGWNLPLESDDSFDATICSALHFFFRLLHFRLKSVPYFKELDVLEPEWDFLFEAVHVVPGADVIVAHRTATLVNRVFARIIAYFQREIQAPAMAPKDAHPDVMAAAALASTPHPMPATVGRLTQGRVPMSVADMTRWIHTVFTNTRVRSRHATGFARRIRTLLETSAEYDLRVLKQAKPVPMSPPTTSPASPAQKPHDLHTFLQTLLAHDYFLVYTSAFEERGVFVLAEPGLDDQPQTIQNLIFQCVRPHQPSMMNDANSGTPGTSAAPHYLLFLTPREPFLWTGRVMTLPLPWIDIDMKDQRLRLVADGTGARLEQCKRHFAWLFAQPGEAAAHGSSYAPASFPLTAVYERMSHLYLIQHELKLMTKAGYVLTDTVVRAVPVVRRQMLRLRPLPASDRAACDELVHSCFGIAFDQGARALAYIQSVRLHALLSTALVQLSMEWISFICDDCVPTERLTFKWAVAALEQAMKTTTGENIFLLSEREFVQLRTCVSSCMALLISHFDVLGARSNALQEQEVKRAQRLGEPRRLTAYDEVMAFSKTLSEHRLAALAVHDETREEHLRERRLIGHVLDDTRLENRNLQLLASKGVQMRWQQGRFIGGGTFGTVYLAVNLDTGGLMAVKEIRFQELSSQPALFQQIHDEMQVMEMLRHPNIVEYYGIEVHRDKVYIFEEYCQGGSLAQLLEHGRIEDEIVLQVYTLQLLDGLMYLHSKGVIHRDIKPENILLDHMGVIKLVDFGAAKVFSNKSRTVKLPAGGRRAPLVLPGRSDQPGQSLQGTPMYMSPEVVRGEDKGRPGALDIWSLGCVILECARGQRPWSHLDNEWAIMFHIGMAQQHPQLPDPSQLSALGIDFIRQCLTIDPFERPSAVELRQHAWIRDLVDELNAENELEEAEAAAAAAAAADTSTSAAETTVTDRQAEATTIDPSSSSTDEGETDDDAAIPTESEGLLQAKQDTLAQAAAAVATPHDAEASATLKPSPPSTQRRVSFNDAVDTNTTSTPRWEPGHPDHSHPGYEALVADVQYRREEEQIKAMLEPD